MFPTFRLHQGLIAGLPLVAGAPMQKQLPTVIVSLAVPCRL